MRLRNESSGIVLASAAAETRASVTIEIDSGDPLISGPIDGLLHIEHSSLYNSSVLVGHSTQFSTRGARPLLS